MEDILIVLVCDILVIKEGDLDDALLRIVDTADTALLVEFWHVDDARGDMEHANVVLFVFMMFSEVAGDKWRRGSLKVG